jgi:biopolymer transport protein ExbD/biopolymer transport protein TolR
MSTNGNDNSRHRASDLNSEINVTPMVDIMLVMLIIFMVVTPLLQSGVTVQLPKGLNPDEDANIVKETAVVVSIPFAGSYHVGRDAVTRDNLVKTIETRMKGLRQGDPEVVYIRGGIGVPYGEIVDVIDFIRQAGFDQIGLVADKLKPNEQ